MKLRSTPFITLFSMIAILSSCGRDTEEIDTEKPVVSINYQNGFPQPCTTLKRGNTYTIRAMATDNVGIASYSIDIHHNFDHHTHDDQPETCILDPKKPAVKPMIYMQNFTTENAGKTYEIIREITIPSDADTGDYHCQFSVIDKTGWQGRTSVDLKIIE